MKTIDRLQTHLKTEMVDYSFYISKAIAKKLVCSNGVALSVQASETHYCTPRNNEGPWTKVEVGFVRNSTSIPESWADYGDGGDSPDIYGYIPIELVADFIDANGGIKES